MKTPLEYLQELLDNDIEDQKDHMSDAYWGYQCYQENGSGCDLEEMSRRISEANGYIKMAQELKIKLSESLSNINIQVP